MRPGQQPACGEGQGRNVDGPCRLGAGGERSTVWGAAGSEASGRGRGSRAPSQRRPRGPPWPGAWRVGPPEVPAADGRPAGDGGGSQGRARRPGARGSGPAGGGGVWWRFGSAAAAGIPLRRRRAPERNALGGGSGGGKDRSGDSGSAIGMKRPARLGSTALGRGRECRGGASSDGARSGFGLDGDLADPPGGSRRRRDSVAAGVARRAGFLRRIGRRTTARAGPRMRCRAGLAGRDRPVLGGASEGCCSPLRSVDVVRCGG